MTITMVEIASDLYADRILGMLIYNDTQFSMLFLSHQKDKIGLP